LDILFEFKIKIIVKILYYKALSILIHKKNMDICKYKMLKK